MRAICVTEQRGLEVREIPAPEQVPSGHLLIEVEACAINHGDKAFLARPGMTAGFATSAHGVWGASAAGRVLAFGEDVPARFAGRKVAVYRSLTASPHLVGLWAEQALVPYTSCVVLPEQVAAEEYSGSLVNAITAYAFLDEMAADGHKCVVVTAGASATGLAMAALAKRRGIAAIFLVRSQTAREKLQRSGVEHILDTNQEGFDAEFARMASQLETTAVFDGVGGLLLSRIVPHLPMNSVVSIYGLLGGAAPVSVSPALFLMKNLIVKRFSNFQSSTVRDPAKLAAALEDLEGVIVEPMFRTRAGKAFRFEQIAEAMAYEETPGAKAILVP